jgi:hypothetical protein
MKTLMHLGALLCATGLAIGCVSKDDGSSSGSQPGEVDGTAPSFGGAAGRARVPAGEQSETKYSTTCPFGDWQVGQCNSSVQWERRCWNPNATPPKFDSTVKGSCTGGRHCIAWDRRTVPKLGLDYKFVGCTF